MIKEDPTVKWLLPFNSHVKGTKIDHYSFTFTLVCSLQITDWDIKIAAAIAGCSLSTYESVLSTVRKALDIQPSVSFKTLAVTLGSTGLVSLAQELWTDFVPRYLDVYTGARRQAAEKEVKSPCWKGAVMFSCAKAFGVSKLYFMYIPTRRERELILYCRKG